MPSPTRRTFLVLGALSGAAVLSGCTGEHEGGHPDGQRPDQDLPLRTKAVAATDALLAGYDAVLAGAAAGAQGALLRQLREEVAQHRAALAQGLPAQPSGSAQATGSASPATTATAPAASAGGAVTTVAALAAAERRTAAERLTDLPAASPALAGLLASVSASGAVHAARLGDTGPVGTPAAAAPSPAVPGTAAATTPGGATGTPAPSASAKPSPLPTAAATGTQSALAAEHAAVYGYGVVCAFLTAGKQREDGRLDYVAHQARRDGWERLLSAAGTGPTPAAAGYRLPFPVKDPATAGQLAAHIETRLTTVYAELAGAGTAPVRLQAADALRESALRALHWGAQPPALPGLPAPGTATGASGATGGSAATGSAASSPGH
ncbi:ferritin-like domain-containing protein [Kitasatospora sp. NPDC048540]|uniref:ferritin-like domain-containing protein n=1 Tax=Kitasatospora sp. NPDC048540 TaxID=3155634 RepID=UPI0033EC8C2C